MYLPKSKALIVDGLPKLEIKAFKKLFRMAERKAERLKGELPEGAITGDIVFNKTKYDFILYVFPEEGAYKVNTLRLEWSSPSGFKLAQSIALIEKRSNLRPSTGYNLFLTNKGLCRVMYQNSQGYFLSRKELDFPHYASQHKNNYECKKRPSKYTQLHKLIEIEEGEEPYRKYGKEHYRGKLTPYGKRIIKYEKKCEKYLNQYPNILPNIF